MDIFTRIHNAEKKSDNDELRKLLKDVRKEVLLLNKLVSSICLFLSFENLSLHLRQRNVVDHVVGHVVDHYEW